MHLRRLWKYRVWKYLLCIALGIGLGGLATFTLSQSSPCTGPTAHPSPTRKLLPVKVFQQETEYSCAGAVARSLLDSYGLLKGRGEAELNAALKTGMTEDHPGTSPENFVHFLKQEGLAVAAGEHGSIARIHQFLDQGIPVIVLDSSWGGHWRLVIGYDQHGNPDRWEANELFFADPEFRQFEPNIERPSGIMSENESRFEYEWYENRLFSRSYERYFIVASPKGRF